MKQRNLLLHLIVFLFSVNFCSCLDENGNDLVKEKAVQIHFNVKFSTFHDVSTLSHVAFYNIHDNLIIGQADDTPFDNYENGVPTDGGTPQTRVVTDSDFMSEWEDGDQIGLLAYITGESGTQELFLNNVKLTYNKEAGTWTPERELYWPLDEAELRFEAYYPYDAGFSANRDNTIAVKEDQDGETGGKSNFSLSDHLTASASPAYGSDVELKFDHTMAMIQLVIEDNGELLDDSQAITATLQNVCLSADDITRNVKRDINMQRLPATVGRYIFRALLPAQTIGQGEVMFRIDGAETLQSAALANAVTLTAGRARVYRFVTPPPYLDITPEPEANSYILTPGSDAVLIPVSQANRVLTEGLGANITGLGGVGLNNYTVELVWGDTPVGAGGVVEFAEAHYQDGEGYIYLKPGVAGNAVIAIRDKESGTIKWSWHIWVTDEVGFATDNGTGLTWMDRNLGATGTTWNEEGKNGLFYQWGRKDAFPDASGSSPATNSSYNTLSQFVQNPGVFTTNGSYLGSAPNTSPTTNPSWGESGLKTIYDPCPPGWRVPPIKVGTNNSWGDASNWNSFVNKGRIFKGLEGNLSIYFPAAGLRNYPNGQLNDPGSFGYYWSSSSYSTTGAWTLTIFSGAANRNNTIRHYGFSVRCVAE